MQSLGGYLDASAALLLQCEAMNADGRVDRAAETIAMALGLGLPVLVCGNGGSAADAQHIAGELVGRFQCERRALPVMALAGDAAVLTALANDYGYVNVFARQVQAFGRPGGVLIGLTTSGMSQNVVVAAQAAKQIGMYRVIFTGAISHPEFDGGAATIFAVPATETPLIQQAHQALYHYICGRVEQIAAVESEPRRA